MSLFDSLVGSDATSVLLSYLRWREIVAVASTSTRIFFGTKRGQTERRLDLSCGVSPNPIPCDPPHCPPRVLQAAPSGVLSETAQGCKWNLGGPLPPSFTYLNEAIHTFDDVGDDFLEGCACFPQCDGQDGDGVDGRSLCPCVELNAAVQSGPAPLFECHAGCSCGPNCRLRATQRGGEGRGKKVPPTLRIRYMGRKGWGAYPVDAIPAGTFVADYTGEVLRVHEARKRVPAYDRDGLNYVLTTQEFFQGGKQVCQTIVDATTSGNVSRFFNHCCDPSLSVFVIRRGTFQRPRLAFYTRDRVEAGCELTYDYGAAGPAGGAVSQGGKRDLDSSSPQQQPVCKTPRRPRRSESFEPVEGGGPGNKSSPHGNENLSHGEQGEKMDEQETAGIAGDSEGLWKSDDTHYQQEMSIRRPCLCGSRCCRGLLPCNRAIL